MSAQMTMRLTLQKRLKRILFSMLMKRLFLEGSKSRVTRLSAVFVFRMHAKYPNSEFFHSREKLWSTFGKHLSQEQWIGFEFGVASGDATKTFLKMSYTEKCLGWHGFDTFMGLPSEWGDLPKGAFSTDGVHPQIKSDLLSWHIGRIENTCTIIDSLSNLDKNFIIIFDFDLYAATKAAWDVIVNHLKSGDIIYFDEAYEADEGQIVNEIIQSQQVKLDVIGYTTMGIAFQVKS